MSGSHTTQAPQKRSALCHGKMMIPRNLLAGFTLIEVLLTVAILGVVLSLAVPAYQNHLIKAKVASALAYATTVKTRVTTQHNDDRFTAMDPISDPDPSLLCITVTRKRPPDCDVIEIEAWPKASLHASVDPGFTRMFTLQGIPNAAGHLEWTCGPTFEEARALDTKFLPGACRLQAISPGDSCASSEQRPLDNLCRFGLAQPQAVVDNSGDASASGSDDNAGSDAEPTSDKDQDKGKSKGKKKEKEKSKKVGGNSKNTPEKDNSNDATGASQTTAEADNSSDNSAVADSAKESETDEDAQGQAGGAPNKNQKKSKKK